MKTRARVAVAGVLLASLAVGLGCGTGNGGLWSATDWDYTVTIFTDLGTCACLGLISIQGTR